MSSPYHPRLIMLALALAAGPRAPAADEPGAAWWRHVQALADDAMEGREAGSTGMRRAQDYVIAQLERAGLQAAGVDGGFLQPVAFLRRDIDEARSSAALIRDGQAEPAALGGDAYFSRRYADAGRAIEAPLVFVGNGLRVPEIGHDDFADVDARGRIVVFISGSPEAVTTSLAGHYSSEAERAKLLREVGAIGYISIPNPSAMDVPWIRMSANRTGPAMVLADPALENSGGIEMAMVWNPAAAEKLFAGSGHSFHELAVLARDRRPLPRFPLAPALRARAVIRETEIQCANIVARWPGRDPALAAEHVVISAHLDGYGIGAPVDGDAIYNGALDNAVGVAALLDLAQTWRVESVAPRRSVLFVLVTAEEKGLLGSKFFAHQPTVPASSLVANINVDMFLPLHPLTVLTVQGLAESDLGDRMREAAAKFGVGVQPDPEPLRNRFIRSDQYSFIKLGVPAVKFDVGRALDSAEQKIARAWLTDRYHAPSDDLSQPVDFSAAVRYAHVLRALVEELANAETRPQWKRDSFFKRYADERERPDQRPR